MNKVMCSSRVGGGMTAMAWVKEEEEDSVTCHKRSWGTYFVVSLGSICSLGYTLKWEGIRGFNLTYFCN